MYENYEGSVAILYWTLTIMNGWMSNTKGLLLCYSECQIVMNRLNEHFKGYYHVIVIHKSYLEHLICKWLASANGILSGWPG